jgi:hypothetical protein
VSENGSEGPTSELCADLPAVVLASSAPPPLCEELEGNGRPVLVI